MSLLIAAKGFTLGLSMIMPIGAQNAMILNQGVQRHHHLTAAGLCAFYDIILIAIGVLGGGLLLNSSDLFFSILTWGGIVFLMSYGALALKAAVEADTNTSTTTVTKKSFKVIIVSSLIVTFLNPHAYVDTVMILGSVGGQYQGNDKMLFMFGAMLASIVWFFTLASGAAKLSVTLSKPKVRRIIDFLIAFIMWLIAASLFNAWVNRIILTVN
ncbi:amino acid transporter [Alteromonadales bacterium alter-6D02]|nr:amino acid transporter [Alteromonadales bacterium alter-6D02]